MTSNANVIAQHAIMHHLKIHDGCSERLMHRRLSDAREIGLLHLLRISGHL